MTSKHYIVAEVWPHGARFAHPNPRTLGEAIEKLRSLVEANRAINPKVACTAIEIYELKGSYQVRPETGDPELPPAEDVLDTSKSVTFPNV